MNGRDKDSVDYIDAEEAHDKVTFHSSVVPSKNDLHVNKKKSVKPYFDEFRGLYYINANDLVPDNDSDDETVPSLPIIESACENPISYPDSLRPSQAFKDAIEAENSESMYYVEDRDLYNFKSTGLVDIKDARHSGIVSVTNQSMFAPNLKSKNQNDSKPDQSVKCDQVNTIHRKI